MSGATTMQSLDQIASVGVTKHSISNATYRYIPVNRSEKSHKCVEMHGYNS